MESNNPTRIIPDGFKARQVVLVSNDNNNWFFRCFSHYSSITKKYHCSPLRSASTMTNGYKYCLNSSQFLAPHLTKVINYV